MPRFYVFFLSLFISTSAIAQLKSKLPIVIIDTDNQSILDEPKITSNMKIISNENGDYNLESDIPNEYNGFIGIELRGSSSQLFPKKPFGLETRDKNGEDLNVPLFGWPKESDWILFASYHEKSLMHNVLTLELARKMGMYASRTKYVELILNGKYQGVYVFIEKIKRDKGRVDIAKLKEDENFGEDLTGGYIFKVDKSTGSDRGGWTSRIRDVKAPSPYYSNFQFEYPKQATSSQKAYIENYMHEFEYVLNSDRFNDPDIGYHNFIEVESFIKYFLLNEVSRNIDGYRISTFLYKDKGEKIVIGPPWDYDISYGNADYCQGSRYDLWSYRFNTICPNDGLKVPFWWEKLLLDRAFVKQLRAYYFEERENGILSNDNILGMVDSLHNVLLEPQERNFDKWPILGTYVWPSPHPIAPTWQGEVDELKTWIENRLEWMDEYFPTEDQLPDVTKKRVKNLNFMAFPNPFERDFKLAINLPKASNVNVNIFDARGALVHTSDYLLEEGENELSVTEHQINGAAKGLYFIQVVSELDAANKTVLKL